MSMMTPAVKRTCRACKPNACFGKVGVIHHVDVELNIGLWHTAKRRCEPSTSDRGARSVTVWDTGKNQVQQALGQGEQPTDSRALGCGSGMGACAFTRAALRDAVTGSMHGTYEPQCRLSTRDVDA